MQLKRVHALLHAWYDANGRKTLPWRMTSDPYAIYISEIMLQQTQVKTVLERYYTPFLNRFPNLQTLADAPESDVLKTWEGLGYYRRAVHLHQAAKAVAPVLPKAVSALKALPGIGQNTAHAIAAFAHKQPYPVMEANVKRVLYRFYGLVDVPEKDLWEYAERLLDRDHPFEYNQAMMDIGALICTKRDPKCTVCPLRDACRGKDDPTSFVMKKTKKQVPTRHKQIVVFYTPEDTYYVSARTTRFLSGLYGFAEYDVGKDILFNAVTYAKESVSCIGEVTQLYSHFRLQADIYYVPYKGNDRSSDWKTLDEIARLPLSKADQKVVSLLKAHIKDR